MQCVYMVKLSMFSLHVLFGIKYFPPHPLACAIFLKFCYSLSDKCFFKLFMCCFFFCVCIEKNGNFLNFSVLWFCLLGSLKKNWAKNWATVVQFSTFCSSILSIQLIFNNISKYLIIFPPDWDALMMSYEKFTTVFPNIET